MTVCLVGLFHINPGAPKDPMEFAAIVISDRMITVGDIQYEPNQVKFGALCDNVFLSIAGDYALHSQAFKETRSHLKGRKTASPYDVATIYGRCIQRIKHKEAEDLYLAPLGMNMDTFISQQRELSETFVENVINQMQSYKGDDVEALIVGLENNSAQLYHVDSRGTCLCLDDVGYGVIGSGAWHARSFLTQISYSNTTPYVQALAAVFAAKKAAEAAPGVGTVSDIYLITRFGCERIIPETAEKLEELHKAFQLKRRQLINEVISELVQFLIPARESMDVEQQRELDRDKQANGSVSQSSSET